MGTCGGERTENKGIIAASSKEDHKWSGKKTEGNESLNTVECLRGRLLAERQASRVAKEEAESMGNKLVELEKNLREEIKLREKAERKLKFLKKKLESFNISSISGESEQSCSPEKCQDSCKSSTTTSRSAYRNLDDKEAKSHATIPATPENPLHYVSETSSAFETLKNPSIPKDYDSQGTDNSSCNSHPHFSFPHILCENSNPSSDDLKNDERSSKSSEKSPNVNGADDNSSNPRPNHSSPENPYHNPNPSSQDLKNDESRLTSLSSKSSAAENEDDGDFVDNSLSLVPVNLPTASEAGLYQQDKAKRRPSVQQQLGNLWSATLLNRFQMPKHQSFSVSESTCLFYEQNQSLSENI